MRHKISEVFFALASASAGAMLLYGCGGGGGGNGGGSAAAATVSGTAATGAPFAGAAISILDKSGNVVGSGISGADGSYTITLTAGATGPFVLQAVREDQTLVSVAPDANSTINITPITNLIASRLAASGDPTKLAAEFQANPNLLTSASITAKVDEVVAVLKPLLDAVGSATNPLTGSFTADGTGADRVLDSLSIKITPSSNTTTNIEIAIKQATADGAQPVTVQFASTATTIATLPPVTAANLIPSGTATLIADLLTKMNACYALPVADRVTTPNTANAGAAAILAAPCREMFYNNDPATFKSNGRTVGSNGASNAFASIFRDGGNNLVFDRGTYEFTRPNGDIVIGYRMTDVSGNVTQDTFVVRPDNASAPTRLQQIGNQYNYDGGIKPYHQLREFVNDPSSAYYSSGYAPTVANSLSGTGMPIFDRVVVTTPSGGTLTLKPKSGFGSLQLVKVVNGSPVTTGTSFARFVRSYVSSAKAALDPATADTPNFFASPAYTEAEIEAIPSQAVWKFDYYLAGNGTALPDATQNYRTRTRALSIRELKQVALADLSDDAKAYLTTTSAATGNIPAPVEGPTPDWTVGEKALAPFSIAVWGNASSGAGFNDSLAVGSTLRSATIPCVKKSTADAHCTGTVVNAPSTYAAGTTLNGFHLLARDPAGREFAHFFATYAIGSTGE